MLSLIIFTVISLSWQAFFLSRLWISTKILFFVSKSNENCRSLPLMKSLIIVILGSSSHFLIALKTGSVMSEVAILLARVLFISKFSTILLKCLLKISATVDSLYLDYSLSRTSLYFEQKVRSLGHLCTF